MKQTLNKLIKVSIILFLYILIQGFVVTIFATTISPEANGDTQHAMELLLSTKSSLVSIVQNFLMISLLLVYRSSSADAKKELPLNPMFLKEQGLCIVVGLCAAIIVSLALSLLPFPEQLILSYNISAEQIFTGSHMGRFFSIVVLAPIAEELIFRGVIYGSLKNNSQRHVAAVLSCILFGLLHWDPIWIIYAFLMGLSLTLTLEAYDSLLAPILLHMSFNFTGTYIMPNINGTSIFLIIILMIAAESCIIRCIAYIKTHRDAHRTEVKR